MTAARFASTVAVVLVLALPAAAQHDHAAPGAPQGFGTVVFETSCDPATAAPFTRGVAQLHSFWFAAAIKAFDEAIAADPSCGIALWGQALAAWGNPFAGLRPPATLARGAALAAKAAAVGAKTPRERAFIAAVGELYRDHETRSQAERVEAYVQAMARVAAEHPDVEARAFYGLALAASADPQDKTYARQLKAGEILEPLFAEHPEHPGLAHYVIHAYDYPPLASRALTAARRYADIAPAAPHALHMPSHTFTRVGLWEESVATNIRSAEAAKRDGATAEELHALDYQTYAYLQTGRDQAARRVVETLASIAPRLDPASTGAAAPGTAGTFALNAIPARYALERGDWAAASALTPHPGVPYAMALTHFARALGAARSDRPAAARPDLDRLVELRDTLAKSGDAYWAGQVEIQRRSALAWVLRAEGKDAAAVAEATAAADLESATEKSAVSPGPLAPARELLGDLLLDLGRPGEALAAYEQALEHEPRRFRSVFGAARAAELAGQPSRARARFGELLEICAGADATRPELRHAKAAVAGE